VLDACYVALCIIIFFSSVSNTKFCKFSKIVGHANEVPYNSDFSQCSMQVSLKIKISRTKTQMVECILL